MKKNLTITTVIGLLMSIFLPSCLEDYLNEAPDAGLTTEVVFSKYTNIMKFFDAVYDGQKVVTVNGSSATHDYNIKCAHPLYFSMRMEYTWDQLTDMSDAGRLYESQAIKGGQMGGTIDKWASPVSQKNIPILRSMFECIRICNMTLKNANMVQDALPADIND